MTNPGLHPPQSLFGPRVKRAVPEGTVILLCFLTLRHVSFLSEGTQQIWRNFLVAPCNGLQSDRFEQSNILRDPDDFNHYLAAIKCRAGFVPNLPNGKATCRNGVWTPRKPECLPRKSLVSQTTKSHIKNVRTEMK